jgi:cytochrome c oxidase subunit 2
MRFHVVAHEQADFDAWVREQQADAASASGVAAQGQEVFAANCIQCHAINGLTDAQGEPVIGAIQAPNLTHLMSRECFAGCILEMNTENLTRWVSDAPSMKPGSLMPSGLKTLGLTPEQVDAVVAYLETLR